MCVLLSSHLERITRSSVSFQVQSALRTFLIAMMLYPEVQKKAQAAIDTVVQGQSAPSLQDKESLPYVEAILKELLRYVTSREVLVHC